MVVIVDYGTGNIRSIANMLKKIGVVCQISSKKEDIKDAARLILPGVGAFDNAMKNIKALDLIGILNEKVLNEKIPILGICLGMQIMTLSSDEGNLQGLSWLNAKTTHFKTIDQSRNLRIPHMGWNNIYPKSYNFLFSNMEKEEMRFYFVHSYFVECKNREDIISTSKYGIEFTSAFRKDNIFGVQFHPEKSHKFGMQVLKNFVEIC